MKTKIPIVNNKSFMLVDEKGNKDIFLNCQNCGKPINKTSVEFGMDCEDKCGEKAYKKLIKTNPQAKLFAQFMKSIAPKELGGEGRDDTKEEAFQRIDNLFAQMENLK